MSSKIMQEAWSLFYDNSVHKNVRFLLTYLLFSDIMQVNQEDKTMMNTNITSAREKLYSLASSCIKYNNIININTLNLICEDFL